MIILLLKIPWPIGGITWLSMTTVIFHDFPNFFLKFYESHGTTLSRMRRNPCTCFQIKLLVDKSRSNKIIFYFQSTSTSVQNSNGTVQPGTNLISVTNTHFISLQYEINWLSDLEKSPSKSNQPPTFQPSTQFELFMSSERWLLSWMTSKIRDMWIWSVLEHTQCLVKPKSTIIDADVRAHSLHFRSSSDHILCQNNSHIMAVLHDSHTFSLKIFHDFPWPTRIVFMTASCNSPP